MSSLKLAFEKKAETAAEAKARIAQAMKENAKPLTQKVQERVIDPAITTAGKAALGGLYAGSKGVQAAGQGINKGYTGAVNTLAAAGTGAQNLSDNITDTVLDPFTGQKTQRELSQQYLDAIQQEKAEQAQALSDKIKADTAGVTQGGALGTLDKPRSTLNSFVDESQATEAAKRKAQDLAEFDRSLHSPGPAKPDGSSLLGATEQGLGKKIPSSLGKAALPTEDANLVAKNPAQVPFGKGVSQVHPEAPSKGFLETYGKDLLGAGAGGLLGYGASHLFGDDPDEEGITPEERARRRAAKSRNAMIGSLGGAALGGLGAHYLA